MSGWDRGYGDIVLRPDLATLRRDARGSTAPCWCMADLDWQNGEPVVPSPRAILDRQLDRLAERGWTAFAGTELEFIVFDDTYRDAWAQASTTA